jgi:hypothetical protein
VCVRFLAVCVMSAACTGCGSSPAEPTPTAVAVVRIGGETFRVGLTSEELVKDARAAMNGGTRNIPAGRIVAGTEVNMGYGWHLEGVEFVEVAVELCDGLPSAVERAGPAYAGGRYCPWGAKVVSVIGPS